MPHITFRRLTPQDLPLVDSWLTQPHVRAAWDDEAMELSDGCTQWLSLVDGRPVGYIQSYQAIEGHAEGRWREVQDPGVFGVDQFLADGHALNRGMGSRVMYAFVQELLANPRVTCVQADPSPDNPRAIRSYEKAGFVRVGQVTTPDGPAVLLHFVRPSPSGPTLQ